MASGYRSRIGASGSGSVPSPSNVIDPLGGPIDNQFSVSLQNGISSLKTYDDVKKTMETPDYKDRLGAYDAEDLDAYQHLNPALFQIISTGINNIVRQLKFKLGTSFLENNESAKDIMLLLDNLSDTINTEDNKLDKNIVQTDLYIKDNTNIPIKEFYADNINPDDAHMIDDLDFWNNTMNTSNGSIFNKDDANLIMMKDSPLQLYETDFENGNLKQDSKLMVRLRNCQNLEFLYLKKHDEILKIFAFTINLFDKYKYAVKVMLYLLKNLVDKDYKIDKFGPPVDREIFIPGQKIYPTITLPGKIITNMKKLLADQKTIQGVITQMDTTLKSNKLTKIDPVDNNFNLSKTELGQGVPVAPVASVGLGTPGAPGAP